MKLQGVGAGLLMLLRSRVTFGSQFRACGFISLRPEIKESPY
jgi:hypothetical protein